LDVLKLGLNFTPTPLYPNKTLFIKESIENLRRFHIKSFFQHRNEPINNKNTVQLRPKSHWWPPITDTNLNNKSQEFFDSIIKTPVTKLHNNIPTHLKEAINQLKNNQSIIIKPADKGCATVILDKSQYKNEVLRQLNNKDYYAVIDMSFKQNNINKIKHIASELLTSGFICKKEYEFLTQPTNPERSRPFYILPKIHKDRHKWTTPNCPEGRPIISDCGSETFNSARFLNQILLPLANKHPSFVKDTPDFLAKIKNIILPDFCILVTADVSSLYTNLELDVCLENTLLRLLQSKYHPLHASLLVDLLNVNLKYNDFTFDGRIYNQTCGVAMGKSFAPSLANICLINFDNTASNNFNIKPLCWYRYIDDIFFVWPAPLHKLKEFENWVNTLMPKIKLSFSADPYQAIFLDTTIKRCGRRLVSDIYFKPTNKLQLLHKRSFHPQHCFTGIIKSQLLRYKRICTTNTAYIRACNKLKTSVRKQGYTNKDFKNCKKATPHRPLPPTTNNQFALIYKFNPLSRIGVTKFRRIFANQDTKILAAYSKGDSIKDILVRSHF
jgi:hypothetical protein